MAVQVGAGNGNCRIQPGSVGWGAMSDIYAARAALAAEPVGQPVSQPYKFTESGDGPTDEELLAMRSWSSHGHTFDSDLVDFARAVLSRWGRPAATPAPEPSLREQALDKTIEILIDPNRVLLTEVREALVLNLRVLYSLPTELSPATPAPEVGEVGEIADHIFAELQGFHPRHRVFGELTVGGLTRAATLLQQISAPALVVVSVVELEEVVFEKLPDLRQNLETVIKCSRAYDGYSTMTPVELADRIIDAVAAWLDNLAEPVGEGEA